MKKEKLQEREWQAMFVARLLKAIGKDEDLLLMARSPMSGTTTALKILDEAIDQLKALPPHKQHLKPNGLMLTSNMVRMIKEHQIVNKNMFYKHAERPATFYREELLIETMGNDKNKQGGKRKGAGRTPKFNEPTKTVSFRCPKRKVDELKSVVNDKLSEWRSQGSV